MPPYSSRMASADDSPWWETGAAISMTLVASGSSPRMEDMDWSPGKKLFILRIRQFSISAHARQRRIGAPVVKWNAAAWFTGNRIARPQQRPNLPKPVRLRVLFYKLKTELGNRLRTASSSRGPSVGGSANECTEGATNGVWEEFMTAVDVNSVGKMRYIASKIPQKSAIESAVFTVRYGDMYKKVLDWLKRKFLLNRKCLYGNESAKGRYARPFSDILAGSKPIRVKKNANRLWFSFVHLLTVFQNIRGKRLFL